MTGELTSVERSTGALSTILASFVTILYISPSRHRPVVLLLPPLHFMSSLLQPSPLQTINPTSLSTMTVIDPEPPQSFTIPGPSSEPTSPTRASAHSSPLSSFQKRRRQDKDTAADMDRSAATTGPIRNARKDVPKKKKAARACIHCQRAHLTCDDGVYPLMSI
jgi:hypothetical protein